ncbi:MAG: hypothetical protein IPO23_00075 [Flavobacterium sp.]|nr:hypothetical protein [Flavobacterium sp.]
MKKKLEADLISIAHRILKLKNKSELVQLHQETQKLYEKLSVLLFVEENFGDVKPTIGTADIEKKIEEAFETPTQVVAIDEPQVEIQAEVETEKEEVVETISEIIEEEITPEAETITAEVEVEQAEVQEEEISAELEEEKQPEPVVAEEPIFKPAFELAFESKIEEDKEEVKSKSTQITFDDLLGPNYSDPVFVKPEELEKTETESKNVIPIGRNLSDSSPVISINKDADSRTVSLNDRLSKGITIGLNDRIAFMKHLFANSSEDYNRVLSQLITFDTFQEAESFIDTMVKPDYNNWEGKEEYAVRFMEILEKRFS